MLQLAQVAGGMLIKLIPVGCAFWCTSLLFCWACASSVFTANILTLAACSCAVGFALFKHNRVYIVDTVVCALAVADFAFGVFTPPSEKYELAGPALVGLCFGVAVAWYLSTASSAMKFKSEATVPIAAVLKIALAYGALWAAVGLLVYVKFWLQPSLTAVCAAFSLTLISNQALLDSLITASSCDEIIQRSKRCRANLNPRAHSMISNDMRRLQPPDMKNASELFANCLCELRE